ncbi:hypothetical protein TNCV_141021 [Trichonephila clavipes]|nr:hypothetical protein TNCV_141021 [Trichonephila clavipes]
MPRKSLSVLEALAIFELPSDNDSAASHNSNDDDDDVENFAQGENIPSDNEKNNEIQLPSTPISLSKQKAIYTGNERFAQPEKTFITHKGCVGPKM